MANQHNDRRHLQQELDRLRDDGFRKNDFARNAGQQLATNPDD